MISVEDRFYRKKNPIYRSNGPTQEIHEKENKKIEKKIVL